MMSDAKNKEEQERNWAGPFLFLACVVAVVLVVGYFAITCRLGAPDGPGVFGDMFGGFNALFSGMALAGVVLAIYFQSKDLKLQREELRLNRVAMEDQRQEMEDQRKVMDGQLDAFKQQQFESTFFNMLSLFNELIDSMGIQKSGYEIGGRDNIARFVDIVSEGMRIGGQLPPPGLCIEKAKESFGVFYNEYSNEVGHYFRTLYNIIKYVDESQVADKYLYTRMVRARLSTGEVVLLFLNCNWLDAEKMKPLVEKYSLLKHLPAEVVDLPEYEMNEIKKNFAPKAFDKNQ